MVIKEIKLENYGRHKSLHLKDLSAPIIGIVGANGNGKSTILKAIAFAFKGKEDDSAITESISIGEESGSIELSFEKQGTNGRIIRKFGKKDSALLEWGDEKLTRKTEINKKIDEILGVDKQVLSNTIFIKQGEMLELVNATPAKRIELFSKLLNLDYFTKRYGYVNAVYKEAKESIKDLHSLEDDIGQKEIDLANLKNEIDTEGANLDSSFISHSFIDQLSKALNDYNLYQNLYNSRLNELQNLPEKNLLEKSLEEYTDRINNLNDKENLLQSAMEPKRRRRQVLELKAFAIKNILERANCIVDWIKASSNLNSFDVNYIKFLESKNNRYKEFITAKNNWFTIKDKFFAEYKRLENNKNQFEEAKEKVKSLEPIIQILKLSIDNQTEFLSLREKIFHKLTKDDKCPICGLRLLVGQEITQQDLDKLKNEIEATKNILLTNEKAKAKYDATINNFTNDNSGAGLSRVYSSFMSAFKDIFSSTIFSPITKDEQAYIQEYYKASTEASIAKAKIISNYKLEYNLADNIPSIAEDIDTFNVSIVEAERDKIINEISSNDLEIKSIADNKLFIYDNITKIRHNLLVRENCEKSCKELMDKKAALKIRESIEMLEALRKESISIEVLEKELLPMALAKYDALKVKRGSASIMESSIAMSKNMLIAKKADNSKQFDYLYKLNAIAEGLNIKNKDSLPKAYVNYLFKYIVEYVKESLALMETNFVIDIDQEEELAVKFKRITDLDKPWLKMQRLSGGEKVRLSIAFLIAMQKIICPNLGFLVLDEPSTHLDSNSVEALADMLTSVSSVLKTTKSQIWFVDHNPALERCCNKKITI
jgi:exonuclease SbcC